MIARGYVVAQGSGPRSHLVQSAAIVRRAKLERVRAACGLRFGAPSIVDGDPTCAPCAAAAACLVRASAAGAA